MRPGSPLALVAGLAIMLGVSSVAISGATCRAITGRECTRTSRSRTETRRA